MHVNYQRDSLDTVRYIDLPAYARIHERRFRVIRWSFQGFYVELDDDEVRGGERSRPRVPANVGVDGEETRVEFVLPFATHETAVTVTCRPTPAAGGQAYFAFLDLQQSVRKLMRDYFESSLASIEPDHRADYSLVVPLSATETRRLNGSLLRRLAFYLVVAAALATAGFFLWREFSYVYSLRGTVMGDLVQYRSPDQSYIRKIWVKDGDRVAPGQLLYELNHDAYDQQFTQLKLWKAQAEEEVKAAQDSIEEEATRAKLYTLAAESKLQMVEAQRTGLLAQVETANGILRRERSLLDAALITRETFDVAQGNVGQLRAQLQELEAQIALEKVVVEQSKENRFLSTSNGMSFTGFGLSAPTSTVAGSTSGAAVGATSGGSSLAIFDIKGNLPMLRAELAGKKTTVAQIAAQCGALESAIARCAVHSSSAGVVNHVNRRDGDSVATSDYVMSVTDDADADRTYVAARFTAEDARFIAYGMSCEIVSLTRNETFTGKVDAIDSGLGQRGSLSPDEEMAADQLVVKFELPAGVHLRGGESVFVKLRRGVTLAGFLQKFR